MAEPTTRSIVRDGIAVGIATGAYGVSFGAIGSGGSPIVGALSGLLLGTRNTLCGLKVAPLVGWHGSRKFAAAHLVIDESPSATRAPTASTLPWGVRSSGCCGRG